MTIFSFVRLQNELGALIARTPAGQRLISEPELAKQFGVSRATLREAMRSFEAQGMIRRRQGSGTYVIGATQALESGLEVLESLDAMASRLGFKISVANLSVEEITADEAQAGKLNLEAGAALTRVRRVIRTDNRPVAYLVDILPVKFLKSKDLSVDLFRGSVLDFLIARGDALKYSRADVSAVSAAADVAKALEIQRGDVLLHFSAQLFNVEGAVVDYSLSYFIPGHFHFHIVRKIAG